MTTEKDSKLILDGHKLAWHKERVEAWMAGERIAPITMDFALTRNCNYHCKYCYGMLQENERKPLHKDAIYRFLDDAAEIGVKGIGLVSDGESTCSPHFYDVIKRGKENGIDMATGTNGALLREDKLEEMLSNLTYIRFNISAGEPERYREIHGCKPGDFEKVKNTITTSSRIKKEKNLDVTIGLQMVFTPDMVDQLIPLAKYGREVGADYLVIKHCSDDEQGTLGVKYDEYFDERIQTEIQKAEEFSTEDYNVIAKWSKILSDGKRKYTQCYGPPFMIQLSGSGLVAPCGMLFNERYKEKFHIGNIAEESFKQIWESDRYWEVMDRIASPEFNAQKDCGTLCFQHKVNEYLWDLKQGDIELMDGKGKPPAHVNFI